MDNVHEFKPRDTRDDEQKAFDNYNIVAKEVGIPVARVMTIGRRDKLTQRLADVGGLEAWNEALGRLETSTWMHGRDGGWRASLDFLLQTESTSGGMPIVKLLEGTYSHE